MKNEKLVLFKGYGAILLRNFRINVGTARTEQTFEKAARN